MWKRILVITMLLTMLMGCTGTNVYSGEIITNDEEVITFEEGYTMSNLGDIINIYIIEKNYTYEISMENIRSLTLHRKDTN